MNLSSMDYISYDGCSYPLRHVEFDGADWTFAPLRLAYALEDEYSEGGYGFFDEEAQQIDEGVFYYLDADEWCLTDAELVDKFVREGP